MSNALIDAIEGATEEELQALRTEIAELTRRLKALKRARAILKARLAGGELLRDRPRSPGYCHIKKLEVERSTARNEVVAVRRSGRGMSEVTKQRLRQIAHYLIHAGPTKGPNLARALDIDYQIMIRLLHHAWFEKLGEGWRLTEIGRKEYEAAA